MTPDDDAMLDALRAEVRSLVSPAPFDLCSLGLYCHRDRTGREALRRVERAMRRSGVPLRLFDFNLGDEDLRENIVPSEGADPAAYEGVRGGAGGDRRAAELARVFRADHHFDLPRLADESTTPLVLRWIRALHARGRATILDEIARSRYLADHCDADILLSNHIARMAADRRFVESEAADFFAAAALRNDYVRPPPPALEPFATRVFFACVGMERAIRKGEVGFGSAMREWLPALEPWLRGLAEPDVARRLDAWEQASREKERASLEAIARWEQEGRLVARAEGALLFLDAPRRIDNSELFLYVLGKAGRELPRVQVLRYPEAAEGGPGRHVFKVRAHGDFDLFPVLGALARRFPTAGFTGRRAAGGSRPVSGVSPDEVLATIAAVIARDRSSERPSPKQE